MKIQTTTLPEQMMRKINNDDPSIPLWLITKRIKKEGPYFHSICLLVNNKKIWKNVRTFHKAWRNLVPEIDSYNDCLQKRERLHFTMLLIPTNTIDKLNLAIKVMKQWRTKILEALKYKRYKFHLSRVNAFKDESRVMWEDKNTTVLSTTFEDIKDHEMFQKILHIITSKFIKSRLLKKRHLGDSHVFYNEKLKKYRIRSPHMTLANTNSVLEDRKLYFDSTEVLEEYSEMDFGSFYLDNIAMVESDDTDLPKESVFDLEVSLTSG